MARQNNPFNVLQPRQRSAQAPTFQDDPFGDDDDTPVIFGQNSNGYGGTTNGVYASGGNGPAVDSSKDGERQQGFTMDPFFDE